VVLYWWATKHTGYNSDTMTLAIGVSVAHFAIGLSFNTVKRYKDMGFPTNPLQSTEFLQILYINPIYLQRRVTITII